MRAFEPRLYFKSVIADYLEISERSVTLFWKGRVAFFAILKALGIKEGDEIIVPGFSCVVVINPILYLGATPIYVDIDPETFTIDPNLIEEKITERTRLILAQNCFGLAPDLDPIIDIADRNNIVVVEDCAHGFGGYYKGKKNGTIAPLSFFSTQWNKPFSTGLGGIAISIEERFIEALLKLEASFIEPSLKDKLMLLTQLFAYNTILNSKTYWFALKTYRTLSKYNIIVGSSQGYELEETEKPPSFEKRFSTIQAIAGLLSLRKRIERIVEHRRMIAQFYKKELSLIGVEPIKEPEYAFHTYLRYPLFVKDRDRFLKLAEREKIEIGDWFLSPIHPIKEKLDRWKYKIGSCPIGEKLSKHIVNLPTHLRIDKREAERIVEFVYKNRELVFNSIKEFI